MKHLSGMLLVTLVAAALMQLYRAHVELKYSCEALAWQVKCENDQFKVIITTSFIRTHRDAQKIAELEAQIKALTTEKPNQLTTGRLPPRFSQTFPRLPGVFTTGSSGFPNELIKPTIDNL